MISRVNRGSCDKTWNLPFDFKQCWTMVSVNIKKYEIDCKVSLAPYLRRWSISVRRWPCLVWTKRCRSEFQPQHHRSWSLHWWWESVAALNLHSTIAGAATQVPSKAGREIPPVSRSAYPIKRVWFDKFKRNTSASSCVKACSTVLLSSSTGWIGRGRVNSIYTHRATTQLFPVQWLQSISRRV